MASLKKNITSLIFVQICNYIIPLLQLPYLSRILGVELFGIMVFILALIQFVNVLTDYGFNLYIPQIIANGYRTKKQVSFLLSNFFFIKVLFSIFGYCIFWGIILLNSDYNAYYLYILIISFSILGNSLFPMCIYQGLEKLNTISKIIIPCKLLALLSIIVLVKSKDDFLNIAIINMLQVIGLTIISFIVLSKNNIVLKICFINKRKIADLLNNSFPFFISRVSVSLYTVGGGVFLGIFSNPIQVAYYNVAEQLYKAGQQVFMPFTQALYPYMMRTKNYRVFFKIILLAFIISLLGACIGWFWGDQILSVIFGINFIQAKSVLDIFMVVIIFNTLAVMLGYPALSPLGLAKYANRSVILSGVIQLIILCYIFIFQNVNSMMIVYSILVCEIFTFLYRLKCFFFYKK